MKRKHSPVSRQRVAFERRTLRELAALNASPESLKAARELLQRGRKTAGLDYAAALNLASQNKLDQAIDMLQKAKAISPGRVELERNMRIITTLKEGADDFYTKQNQKPAKPEGVKKEAASAPATTEKKEAKSSAPVKITPENKTVEKKAEETPKVTVKKETVKTPSKTVTKTEVKVEKVEPAAAASGTNARGSKQNFNNSSASIGNE